MVDESVYKEDPELSIDKAKQMDWYHAIELTPDFTTKGVYNWAPYWDKFNFGDLCGKTILDVGAADGFFSFEFEKRGAQVTALDIPSQEERDSTKMGTRKELSAEVLERSCRSLDFEAKFSIAKELLGSKVERVEMDLYDMSKENIGLFDIVFCGDTLLHLTDPVRALTRIRDVCKEIAIISTPICSTSRVNIHHPLQKLAILALSGMPLSYFLGAAKSGAFWIPNRRCLRDMIIASGFKREKWISSFTLSDEHVITGRGARMERGVIHGLVD